MTAVYELSHDETEYLAPYLPQPTHEDSKADRIEKRPLPFVTLTYASSLDSMIAAAPGVRTTLSGQSSKNMTHYLRLHHDAILVGVGTAIADDPSLNCRYPGATLDTQPTPMVVDPSGRWKFTEHCKLFQLAKAGQGKAPVIISKVPLHGQGEEQRRALDAVGGVWLDLTSSAVDNTDTLSWNNILECLKERGHNSVMVEGGGAVINELIEQRSLLDSIIVTIAPVYLGLGGVRVSPPHSDGGSLQKPIWRQFGRDVVLAGKFYH